MQKFRKRIYTTPGAFLKDVGFLMRNFRRINAIFNGERLDPAFRERIMLAVTHVNECRFCASFHTKAALAEKVSHDEINALLDGSYKDCPAEEIPAIRYGEHWAETAGKPDAAIREKLLTGYDQETVKAIEIVLRVIKTGNLTGNTVDRFLFCISFGRWGR